MNVLVLAAWAALIVFLLGFWLVRQSTWRSEQLSYTPDPTDANVRTAEQVSSDGSGHNSYRLARWREVRLRGGEWVRDGAYIESTWGGGPRVAQGTYHDGKRQGSWTFWCEDGSVDGSRSGTYDNDVLIERARTPRGDFEDADSR